MENDMFCKHCGLPIGAYYAGAKFTHMAGPRMCISAVTALHDGPWTKEFKAYRESLRYKAATRTPLTDE